MNRIIIHPVEKLSGTIQVSGDKSISHRSLLLGAMAEGMTEVFDLLEGEDCLCTLEAIQNMGVKVEKIALGHYRIHGVGRQGFIEPKDVLNMGNSGTGMRLLAGVLAGQDFVSVMTGDSSLRERPMRRIVEPLSLMGAKIDGRESANKAPLIVRGGHLKGIEYHSKQASAQVKSAILLAGLNASGETTVHEPGPSRDHSERMMKAFGASIEKSGNTVKIQPGATLKGQTIHVPGDISSAAFFIAAALIVPGSRVRIENIGLNPTRTGLLEALQEMNRETWKITDEKLECGEEIGTIEITSGELMPSRIGGETVVRMIDEFPVWTVLAAFGSGKSVVEEAEELRYKESDRIAVMAKELSKMGADVEEMPDGMIVRGGQKLVGAQVDSHGDHRIAMSLAIAGLRAEGETVIENTTCIGTSFPKFTQLLRDLGANVIEE